MNGNLSTFYIFYMCAFSVRGKKANNRKQLIKKNALDNGMENSLERKEDMKQMQENRLNKM